VHLALSVCHRLAPTSNLSVRPSALVTKSQLVNEHFHVYQQAVIKAGEYFEALYLLLTFIAILRVALRKIKTND